MRQEPVRPTTCDRCGERFNTSEQHPRRYCSIACEEGRSRVPESDPSSPGFPNHVSQNPDALVGKSLMSNGLKRTCYSPDWHRSPDDYNARNIVTQDTDDEILVYETSVHLGQVKDYENGLFIVERDDTVTAVQASTAVSQLRDSNWWACK